MKITIEVDGTEDNDLGRNVLQLQQRLLRRMLLRIAERQVDLQLSDGELDRLLTGVTKPRHDARSV